MSQARVPFDHAQRAHRVLEEAGHAGAQPWVALRGDWPWWVTAVVDAIYEKYDPERFELGPRLLRQVLREHSTELMAHDSLERLGCADVVERKSVVDHVVKIAMQELEEQLLSQIAQDVVPKNGETQEVAPDGRGAVSPSSPCAGARTPDGAAQGLRGAARPRR